jgi:hypothetical protein
MAFVTRKYPEGKDRFSVYKIARIC